MRKYIYLMMFSLLFSSNIMAKSQPVKPEEVKMLLHQMATEQNQYTPRKLDDFTILSKVEEKYPYLSFYLNINVPYSEIKKLDFSKTRTALINSICSPNASVGIQFMRALFKEGVVLSYYYYSNDNVFIGKVDIDKNSCLGY